MMRTLGTTASRMAMIVATIVCGFAASARAQQASIKHWKSPNLSVVVPPANDVVEADGLAFWALSPFDARRQVVVAARLLSGIRGKDLKGLTVRRNASLDSHEGGRISIEVWVSHAPISPWNMSTSFANNRGADHRKVFDGDVLLPPSPPPGSGPAPWSEPYTATIEFQVPFEYQGGGMLIETVTKDSSSSSPWWPIDASVTHATGSIQHFGSSCIPGMGTEPASAEATSVTLGSTAAFYLRGPTQVSLATCLFGSSKTQFGGIQLPLDLTGMGAPGCHLYVQPSVGLLAPIVPMPAGPFSTAGVQIEIPILPVLEGSVLFAQWVIVDPSTNSMGLTLSNGVEAMIGASKMRNVNWLESTDLNADSGRLLPGRVPVIRFDT